MHPTKLTTISTVVLKRTENMCYSRRDEFIKNRYQQIEQLIREGTRVINHTFSSRILENRLTKCANSWKFLLEMRTATKLHQYIDL